MLRRQRDDRAIFLLAALLVTAYAGLLRYEALVANYGWTGQPGWSKTLEKYAVPVARELRPDEIVWGPIATPYVGMDPINYLRYAGEMQHFYQAHVREPAFLALTRAFLWLTGGRDIAVSFASAAGATLAVFATALLGAAATSPLVGVAAALALAIEFQAITWSIDGWRDDTFTMFVTLSAAAFIWLYSHPTVGRGIVAGVAAAGACLTRITALSFVLPGLLWLIVEAPRTERRRMVTSTASAAAITVVLIAPYLFNCWRATGDPFMAINYHSRYYRSAEGLPLDESIGAVEYAWAKLYARPVATVDTAVQGLITYPFLGKWDGFRYWHRFLGRALQWLAAAGMVVALWSPKGRLLLVILISSLLPYALTWSVGGGGEWRFTQHAYPFYLVFAFWFGADALRTGIAWVRRERRPIAAFKEYWRRAAGVAAAAALAWVLYAGLPLLIVREALAAGSAANIMAGDRDLWFFDGAWSDPMGGGNVTVRVAQAEVTRVRLPLPAGRDYWMTLRIDPAETLDRAQQPRVTVFLNGTGVSRIDLTRNPTRMGSYRFRVPKEAVRSLSRLDLLASHTVPASEAGQPYSTLPADRRVAFRLWYIRLEPAS